MPESISRKLALKRFKEYAQGYCECCGKRITKYKRGKSHGIDSWEAHHAFPDRPVTLENIRIYCSYGRNCHLYCGHDGDYNNKGILPRYCRRL